MDTSTAAEAATPAPAPLGAGLRRRWWLILVCGLLGLAGGAAATQVVSPAYQATTTVLVAPTGAEALVNSNQNREGLVNLETEAQIVTSSEVVERARALLKTPRTGPDLVKDISVQVPPNTSVLAITADTTTAVAAQQEARAFTRAYLDLRTSSANAAIDQQVKALQGQIAAVSKSLQRVAGQAAALPADSPDQAFADAQKRILTDQITELSGTVSQLEAVNVTPGRVLNDAALPAAPSQPVPLLYLGAGTVAGLLAGVALALLVAKLDRRLRSPAEIERLGDVGLLGTVPSVRSSAGESPLVAPIASTIGQAFGRIRNSVVTALPDRPAVLMVAGTDGGPATSLVAANLAAALARAGIPAVLVCADFASSDGERLVGLPRTEDGLAEALVTGRSPQRYLRRAPSVPGLQVLGTGVDTAGATELLQTRRFADVLATVKAGSFVVVEAPPTSEGADAQAMGRMSDAVLLVAEMGRSRIDAVEDAAGQFARVGTPVLGVVVTGRQRPPAGAKRRKGELPAVEPVRAASAVEPGAEVLSPAVGPGGAGDPADGDPVATASGVERYSAARASSGSADRPLAAERGPVRERLADTNGAPVPRLAPDAADAGAAEHPGGLRRRPSPRPAPRQATRHRTDPGAEEPEVLAVARGQASVPASTNGRAPAPAPSSNGAVQAHASNGASSTPSPAPSGNGVDDATTRLSVIEAGEDDATDASSTRAG